MKITGQILLLVAAMVVASPTWAQNPGVPQGRATAPSPPTAATAAGPVYVVTYFEVAPAATRRTNGLLRQFAAETRKADGNVEFLALHEIARAGHYAIVE